MFGILNNQIDKPSQVRRSDSERCDGAGVGRETVHTGARCSKYTHHSHIRLVESEQNHLTFLSLFILLPGCGVCSGAEGQDDQNQPRVGHHGQLHRPHPL